MFKPFYLVREQSGSHVLACTDLLLCYCRFDSLTLKTSVISDGHKGYEGLDPVAGGWGRHICTELS